MSDQPQIEMPRYKCHKEVWALKILRVEHDYESRGANEETDGTAKLLPAEAGYGAIKVDADFVSKHKPFAGGYYVVYSDGYKSFSPSAAFEQGYTKI
jgi:hypothetical protein